MDEKKERSPVWFPFMSHHEWHGFTDYRELVDFLEDGILPSESGYIQEEEILMLPKPKSRRQRRKIIAETRAREANEANEANSNGNAIKPKDGDNITKPIMRVRGGVITEITVPVKKVEPEVIEQSVKIGPIIDGELVETITEDIAYGGNGG